MENPLKWFEDHKLIASIRSSSQEDAEAMMKAAAQGGFRIFEISMQTPHAAKLLETYAKKDSFLVGAGGVVDGEAAQRAVNAGAKFLSNTYTDKEIINVAKNNDSFVIAGASTLTEAFNAYQLGADLVRIYPADLQGGAVFCKALRSSLPFIKCAAQGGITQENFQDYLKHCTAVYIGNALFDRSLVRQDNWAEVAERAKQFTQKLDSIKVTK